MDAFHSSKARSMWQRLPKSPADRAEQLESAAEPDTAIQMAFRKLRGELEEEGWFERDMVHEAKLLGIWGSLVITAAVTASAVPPVATVLLALAMSAAGWLGHDYIHGVDEFSFKMRNFAAFAEQII